MTVVTSSSVLNSGSNLSSNGGTNNLDHRDRSNDSKSSKWFSRPRKSIRRIKKMLSVNIKAAGRKEDQFTNDTANSAASEESRSSIRSNLSGIDKFNFGLSFLSGTSAEGTEDESSSPFGNGKMITRDPTSFDFPASDGAGVPTAPPPPRVLGVPAGKGQFTLPSLPSRSVSPAPKQERLESFNEMNSMIEPPVSFPMPSVSSNTQKTLLPFPEPTVVRPASVMGVSIPVPSDGDVSIPYPDHHFPNSSFADITMVEESVLPVSKKTLDDPKDRLAIIEKVMAGKVKLPAAFSSSYEMGQVLGEGSFGFVVSAKLRRGRGSARAKEVIGTKEAAVKFIVRSRVSPSRDGWVQDKRLGMVPREISILSELDHPNIIRFVELFHANDFLILVTEYHGDSWSLDNPKLVPLTNPDLDFHHTLPRADNSYDANTHAAMAARRASCDLFECIDIHLRFRPELARSIFAQIARAIAYLNSRGYVHRDLKDENVVVDRFYNCKLIDFGSASRIPGPGEDLFTQFNGTVFFAPPEIVRCSNSDGSKQSDQCFYRGPEAEMWSLGVLLYTINYRDAPFAEPTPECLAQGYSLPRNAKPLVVQLLSRLLDPNLHTRATIEEVVAHPYVRDAPTPSQALGL